VLGSSTISHLSHLRMEHTFQWRNDVADRAIYPPSATILNVDDGKPATPLKMSGNY
jgi:hypothetical protein